MPNKTISILLPGQKLIPAIEVVASGVAGHVTMLWIEKMPTLDILEKKSWDDPNEKVLTSIPMMTGTSAYAFVEALPDI